MEKKENITTHFPPLIIPVCIYHREGGTQGYIGTPGVKKGQEKLICTSPATAYEGWHIAGNFYGINPMFVPLPSYMRLICALQSGTGERNYNTEKVYTTYDPFNDQANCVYFLTWTLPVPYSTPLYMYNSGNGILPSFKKRPDLEKTGLTTLFVLTDEPMERTIFPGKKNWFKKKKDGTPDFLFKSYMGRCIPDPDGIPLVKCTLTHDLKLKNPQSLLDTFRMDAAIKKSQVFFVPRFFKKVGIPWVAIIFGVFLLALFVVLFTMFKNKNDNLGSRLYKINEL